MTIYISKDNKYLFLTKVDFKYHIITGRKPFYSLCVFNNASILNIESNNIFDVNVTFINFTIDNNLIGEPNYFFPLEFHNETEKYLSQYFIENEKNFLIRIQEILSLLKKLDLLES